jgi:hypothetical protein
MKTLVLCAVLAAAGGATYLSLPCRSRCGLSSAKAPCESGASLPMSTDCPTSAATSLTLSASCCAKETALARDAAPAGELGVLASDSKSPESPSPFELPAGAEKPETIDLGQDGSGGLLVSFPLTELETAGDEAGAPAATPADDDDKEKPDAHEKTPKPEIDPNLGIIKGKVRLEGDPPKLDPKAVEVPATHQDRAACVDHVKDERLLVSKEGGILAAVVFVEDYGFKGGGRPKPRIYTLDNKNCAFVPHIMCMTTGSTLEVGNSDGFIHNSRGLLALNGLNSAIPPKGKIKKKAAKSGWGVMKCDFHAWMTAHVHIFDHELFAVTEEDGSFTIYNVPPGKVKLKAWHEVLQKTESEVIVEAGKTVEVEVALERYAD